MPIIFKGSGNKKAKLQNKNITPTMDGGTYYPSNGYDGFGKVKVYGYKPYYEDGTAWDSDVREGKSFYSHGELRYGNMQNVTMPNPTIDYSFSSDNSKITIEASYTPEFGYNTSTTKKTSSITITLPEVEVQGNECKFGSLSPSVGTEYLTLGTIPKISGKSLEYVSIIRGSSSYTSYGEYVVQSIVADCSASTFFVTTTVYHGQIPDVPISSNDNSCVINETSSGYSIGIGRYVYSLYSSYQYLAVYG